MGDQNAAAGAAPLEQAGLVATQKQSEQYGPLPHTDLPATDIARQAFHAQIDNLVQPRDNNDLRSFDMRQMSNAMPSNPNHSPLNARRPSSQYNTTGPNGMMGPGSFPYFPQATPHGQQRQDVAAFSRAQPQQFLPQHYSAQAAPYPMVTRQPPAHIQTQSPYGRVEPYAYGMAQPAYSPVDMRYPQPTFPVGYGAPAGYAEMSMCS